MKSTQLLKENSYDKKSTLTAILPAYKDTTQLFPFYRNRFKTKGGKSNPIRASNERQADHGSEPDCTFKSHRSSPPLHPASCDMCSAGEKMVSRKPGENGNG